MHRSIVVIFFLLISIQGFTQKEKKESLIKWYTFEEAIELQKKQPKSLFIDMYTDWCGWCKVMDTTTFIHPQIASYINTHFYPVKFNAERTDTVVFNGKAYVNTGQGRRPPHGLAVELMRGKMSYPTIVYLDNDYNVNPLPGFMAADKIEPYIVYFAEKVNKSAPFEDFEKNYIKVVRNKQARPDKVNWMSFDEAISKNTADPKKILVNIISKYNHGSNIMDEVCFKNPLIAKYINETFYPVKLLAEMTDTIIVGNQTFINELKVPNYPHQLPIALLQGQLFYPSVLFLNEQSQLINKVQGYMIVQDMERVLHYMGDDAYKTKKWEEFKAGFTNQIN